MPGPPLTFRRIDVDRDGPAAHARYRDAARASDTPGDRRLPYLAGLRDRCGEFPDGHVLAAVGDDVVGQLEIQVPYGRAVGYLSWFYVSPRWRRLGVGRRLHGVAAAVELHVAPANAGAVAFYRRLGYRLVGPPGDRSWKMRLELNAAAARRPAVDRPA